MRLMLPLLPLCFLLTSCASSTPFIAPISATPAACQVECPMPPNPRNPAKDYVKDLYRWGSECRNLHSDCVIQSTKDVKSE
jgi:hypothetical protein